MQQDVSKLTADELLRQSNLTKNRRKSGKSVTQRSNDIYCFEIVRRAIVEKDEACWSIMFEQYEKLILYWLNQRVPEQHIGDTHIDEMVMQPFEKLWRFFDTPHLAAAKNLSSLIAYLESCVETCVQEELRRSLSDRNRRQSEKDYGRLQSLPQNPEEKALKDELYERVWQELLSCCNRQPPDRFVKEKTIAWLTFKNGLKPNRIHIENPGMFASIDEIYELKRQLFARLRHSQNLSYIWKG